MVELDYLCITMAEGWEKLADVKKGIVVLNIRGGRDESTACFPLSKIIIILVIVNDKTFKIVPFEGAIVERMETGVHVTVDEDLPLEDLEV